MTEKTAIEAFQELSDAFDDLKQEVATAFIKNLWYFVGLWIVFAMALSLIIWFGLGA
jgi:hypothetical protein